MKVKLKVIEFSSDIFSKSSQLKDIHLSPLFSNTTFNINIFDAISKNSEYEIKVNTPIIKIGLYQGKSLLGIGEIDINKKSQNIKIVSEQNSNQGNNNKIQDNDYYIIIECINNNPINDKVKNINGKENKKRKKNASVDSKAIYKLNNYKNTKLNKYKLNNSLKEYINNYSGDLLNKSNNKNYESRDDLLIKKKNLNNLDDNNNEDSMFNIKSNSTIMNDEQNKMLQNLLMSENVKSKHNDRTFNEIIFNESFQKDKFSDGVLILIDDKTKNGNKNKINSNPSENFIQKMENIDINDFNNLVNDFNLIYNNVNNNNSIGANNLKDNFILEYQYFLEKTSDIFNLYAKLSSKINEQNTNIKKYVKRLNNDIQSLLKKDITLKLRKQKVSMIEISKQNYQEGQKYFNYEINNINNKISLVKNINNDIQSLTNNLKQNKYNKKSEIKNFFNSIINNEKIKEYLKIDEFFMKYMTKKSVSFKLDDINEKNEDEEKEENENENEKPKEKEKEEVKENNTYEGNEMGKININDIDNSINNNEKKIDIEILKNKIDKLKNQYLKETIPNEQKNKSNLNENNKKKKDREARSQKKNSNKHTVSNNRSIKNIHKLNKIKANDNSNITELNTKDRRYKNLHNYYNIFTPSNNRRTKLMKSDF